MNKAEIRKDIKHKKSLLSESVCSKAAFSVLEKLGDLPQFIQADNILCYHALPDELPTQPILDKWAKNKSLFLPRVNGNELEILNYNAQTLQHGSFNIQEPQGDNIINVQLMDIIIVPAIAYDLKGNRIGRGKGYYDRLLQNTNATKIGIIFDFQLLDNIQTDTHDIPVDIVITDKQTIICNQK